MRVEDPSWIRLHHKQQGIIVLFELASDLAFSIVVTLQTSKPNTVDAPFRPTCKNKPLPPSLDRNAGIGRSAPPSPGKIFRVTGHEFRKPRAAAPPPRISQRRPPPSQQRRESYIDHQLSISETYARYYGQSLVVGIIRIFIRRRFIF